MAEEDGQGARSRCQVVVVGDHGTGKSGLIIALATDSFPDKPPPVLPPTCLPPDFYPSRVSLTIVDTSSRQQDKIKTETECKKADAIVLTYSDDLPRTLDRLSTYWLPELRRLEEYREIETIIECSALKQVQETRTLKPRCVRALKRIFMLCDRDKDGALNDAELNDFQVKCFNAPLQLSEIDEVKNVVSEKMAEGVNVDGLTLTGFLFLHALFIEKGRLETTWTVLRKYGYDDEIKLRDDLLQYPSFKRCADAFVELTEKALDFLKRDFVAFDADGDCALRPQQLEELFSTAPSSPWTELTYSDVAETNQVGGLTLNGFLSLWALMTMLEPRKSLSHLIYIGYPDNPSSAFHITNRRRRDRRRQRSDRVVYQCYIFGANKCGKSALLNALIGRPFTEAYERTEDTRYAVNVVDQIVGGRKTLVLREIIEESVSSLFEKKHALSSCDVAAFVYDCADAQSWKRAYELLVQVIAHQEITGYEIPCMIISAKDDLESVPSCTKGSTRVCTDMGLEATISVSTKLGDVGNLFQKIVDAAQHPHRSIPKTEAGRKFKHYRCLIQWSLTVAAVGFGAAVAGNAIYRLCVRRKC
ncbi:mitochondrial Rho GTPase 1 isoform X6 [Physcomitrium patens]|uniref:mitochondrial Rho GTPase 1 isoform X6 n=1 Tax=Physcomitrium patens TaxID=3218 RepID=UPI003CCDCCA7